MKEGIFKDEINLLLECSRLLKDRLSLDNSDSQADLARMQCLEELDYVIGELMFAQDEESYEDSEDYYGGQV